MSVLGQIWPFLGQKCIFFRDGVRLLVSSYQGTNEMPFPCWKHWSVRLQLTARDENVVFHPKIWIFGAKSHFLYGNRYFCQQGISPVCPGLQLSYLEHPQKNSVSELWVIFWCSPLFLAVSGLCHFTIISTLNFGPFSTKLCGTVQAIKIMTQNDNRSGRSRNYGERAVFTFSWKVFFGQKCVLTQKTPTIS